MSVSLKEQEVAEAVEKAIKIAPKRNFKESVDLTVVFRGLDFKRNPSQRLSDVVYLPHPRIGKEPKICVIGRGDFLTRFKNAGADAVISTDDILALQGNKKELRKLVKSYDFFIAQADQMAHIARIIGPIFAPRGKMPTPIPFTEKNPSEVIKRFKSAVLLKMKTQPVLHVAVGTVDMPTSQIVENINFVINYLNRKYGGLRKYLRKLLVKTTMGPPVEIPYK